MEKFWQQNLLFGYIWNTQKSPFFAGNLGPLEASFMFSSMIILLTCLIGLFYTTELYSCNTLLINTVTRCHRVYCSKWLTLYKMLTVYSNWSLYGTSQYWCRISSCKANFNFDFMFSPWSYATVGNKTLQGKILAFYGWENLSFGEAFF